MMAGASWLQRFRRIILPLTLAGSLSGFILAFIATMRELSLIILLITPETRTLTTMTFRYVEQGYSQFADAIILLIVILVVGRRVSGQTHRQKGDDLIWHMIEIEGLTKRFGGVTAVDHLSLAVEAGEFLTLLGPSGCGKTTVLRMIAGLEVPDAGEIRIGGKTVFSARQGLFVSPGKTGDRAGLPVLCPLAPHDRLRRTWPSVWRSRRSSRQRMQRDVAEALAYMQLEGMEDRYPQQMSGGQQQRVALARMLVTRPSASF